MPAGSSPTSSRAIRAGPALCEESTIAEHTAGTAVLAYGHLLPRSLAELATVRVDDPAAVDTAIESCRRLVVVGDDADLALTLTRLLRAGRLDIEVGYVPRRRTAATGAYRLPCGRRAARRARRGNAHRVPLIRDETGTVLVGAASWVPVGAAPSVHGEAVVDDTVLFDGETAGVRIEPTSALPGLRARTLGGRWWRRWHHGRAAQLGIPGAGVIRDGVPAKRPVKRSTFYRHTHGWLAVR
jgi:hypothetical protein